MRVAICPHQMQHMCDPQSPRWGCFLESSCMPVLQHHLLHNLARTMKALSRALVSLTRKTAPASAWRVCRSSSRSGMSYSRSCVTRQVVLLRALDGCLRVLLLQSVEYACALTGVPRDRCMAKTWWAWSTGERRGGRSHTCDIVALADGSCPSNWCLCCSNPAALCHNKSTRLAKPVRGGKMGNGSHREVEVQGREDLLRLLCPLLATPHEPGWLELEKLLSRLARIMVHVTCMARTLTAARR